MEPQQVFSVDRSLFDTELNGLIEVAATAATRPTPTSTSPTSVSDSSMSELRLRKRPAAAAAVFQGHLLKKVKPDDGVTHSIKTEPTFPLSDQGPASAPAQVHLPRHSDREDAAATAQDNCQVHPSRRNLVVQNDKQQPREAFYGPGLEWMGTSPEFGRHERSESLGNDASSGGLRGSSPLAFIEQSPGEKRTWETHRNAVRRQWDTRKDDLEYEALLELRRKEKLVNIDRYVPLTGNPKPSRRAAPRHMSNFFPFDKLPEQVQTHILALLLTNDAPIKIDFTWLRSFVSGHARMPSALRTIMHDGVEYYIPISFNQLVRDVAQMQDDLKPFQSALEERALKTRKTRAPCRGLTTSLLRVSKAVHEQAARIFYGHNTFYFSWPTSAWMQLESFLATIGSVNVSYLRNIRIYAPLWHCGIQEDFLEGAILDLTSPASRMAVIKPPAYDRLLSAITSSVQRLGQAGQLTSLSLDIEHGKMADLWTERYHAARTLISTSDAGEYVDRKRKGVELLERAVEKLAMKPKLTVYVDSTITAKCIKGASEKLPTLVREAEKYGWEVDPVLSRKMRWSS